MGRSQGPAPLASAGAAVLLLLAVLAAAGIGLGIRIAGQLPQLRYQYRQVAGDLWQTFGVQLPGTGGGSGAGTGSLSAGALSARPAPSARC